MLAGVAAPTELQKDTVGEEGVHVRRKRQQRDWRAGDLFTIPTADGRFAIGQAVEQYLSSYFVVIFETIVTSEAEAVEKAAAVVRSPVRLAVLCLDGKIYHGKWVIFAQADVPAHVELPAYKLGAPGWFTAESFHADRTMKISDQDAEALIFRGTVSGAYLEWAVNASLGLNDWDDDVDTLKPGVTKSTREVFGSPDSDLTRT